MEFNVGDLIIATNLSSPTNGYVNGDILMITRKVRDNKYYVKIIYKYDAPDRYYTGDIGWVVGDEHQYFQLFE